jgi:hypothetical protein
VSAVIGILVPSWPTLQPTTHVLMNDRERGQHSCSVQNTLDRTTQ